MRVDIVQVLPDKLDDYIELQQEEVNPALQRAGVPYRSAWRTAEFGNTYERLFVTPIDNLAVFGPGPTVWQIVENHSSYVALEQPSILERTFGDQAAAVAARLSGIVTIIERTVLRYDAELSYSAPLSSTE